MRTLTRFARLVSPIARLHNQRNEALQKLEEAQETLRRLEEAIGSLTSRLDETNAEANNWRWRYEAQNSNLEAARSEGRLAEFDYPYFPRVRDWARIPGGNPYRAMISQGHSDFEKRLKAFASFSKDLARIPLDQPADEAEPFWDNGWFPPLDAVCLYGLIACTNPKVYTEVGSGNSTKFVRRAIKDHGLRTKIVSIDPYPRAVIDRICDEVIRTPFEQVDISRFQALEAGDVMFVDNSHRSFQNSDVTVFFTEVLPTLKAGVLWGVHDIFLPQDYPEAWLGRLYNEQYMLMAYLLGGAAGDRVEIPVAYLAQNPKLLSENLGAMFTSKPWGSTPLVGGAFWMQKA